MPAQNYQNWPKGNQRLGVRNRYGDRLLEDRGYKVPSRRASEVPPDAPYDDALRFDAAASGPLSYGAGLGGYDAPQFGFGAPQKAESLSVTDSEGTEGPDDLTTAALKMMAGIGSGSGSGGGVNYRAMVDYLEGSRSSMLQPFADAEARIGTMYGDSRQRLTSAQQAMMDRIVAAGDEQRRIAAGRDAALERSAATYGTQSQAALQALLRDMGAQGAPTAPLDAVAALRAQQTADLGARDAALRAQLDAALAQRIAGYNTGSEQQNAAALASLERARTGALAGVSQQRAAAEASLNQKLAELRSRMG